MWERNVLKTAARENLRKNYWHAVAATALITILTGLGLTTRWMFQDSDFFEAIFDLLTQEQLIIVFAVVIVVGAFLSLLAGIFQILVINPLRIGYAGFVLSCDKEDAGAGTMFSTVKGRYCSLGIKVFSTELIIFLWSLLLIVPGLVKGYSYSLVSFLLAENPELSGKEARAKSEALMDGSKWNAFVLDLSFIGWWLLSGLTLGILAFFYVTPYVSLTGAELYKALAHPQMNKDVRDADEPLG